jgi:hypothetical protein
MPTTTPETTRSYHGSFWMLIGLNALFMFITQYPLVSLITVPLNTFVTTLHELGHAVACVATLGDVKGLTIVSDGNGHGGLTFCQDGVRWLVSPAGYLGATLFGCLLLLLAKTQERARSVLFALSVIVGITTLAFMTQSLIHGVDVYQSLASIAAGALICAGLFLATKLGPRLAHLVLLILAGQTALNALSSAFLLVALTVGIIPSASFSDATNMAQITGVPAAIWSLLWGGISAVAVYQTLKRVYR